MANYDGPLPDASLQAIRERLQRDMGAVIANDAPYRLAAGLSPSAASSPQSGSDSSSFGAESLLDSADEDARRLGPLESKVEAESRPAWAEGLTRSEREMVDRIAGGDESKAGYAADLLAYRQRIEQQRRS